MKKMKKVFFMIILMLVAFTESNGQDNQHSLKVNADGKIHLQVHVDGIKYKAKKESVSEWVDTDITAHVEALAYRNVFYKAVNRPGESILVGQGFHSHKMKSLFTQEKIMENYFLVYDNKSKSIDYKSMVETSTVPSYNLFIIMLCIIIIIIHKVGIKRELYYSKKKWLFSILDVANICAIAVIFGSLLGEITLLLLGIMFNPIIMQVIKIIISFWSMIIVTVVSYSELRKDTTFSKHKGYNLMYISLAIYAIVQFL